MMMVLKTLAGRLRERRAARRRSMQLTAALPLTAELMRTAVTAGLPPASALEHVAPWTPDPVRTELVRAQRELDAGLRFGDVLGLLVERAPELRRFARTLGASAELGSEIGPALARLARDERERARRAAEARARTVPVRLLFPLVFLVLPAFVLLGIVPGLLIGPSS